MGRLYLALFGYPEVYLDERRLSFPTKKTLALLTYLAIETGPQARDKLAALFWPEADHEQARAALRTTLARLRSTLQQTGPHPANFLLTTGETVVLDFGAGPIEGDWLKLEAAQTEPGETALETDQARLDLYRGEFLEGLSLGEAPDFEEWAALEREKWRQQVLAVCERLALAYFNRGDFSGGLRVAQRWVALDPLSQAAHAGLIRLYLATQNEAAARRAYEACREIFQRELGLEAPAALTRLITSGSTRSVAAANRSDSAKASPELALQNVGLVGRQAEFASLVETFSRSNQPSFQMVVVEGEAGIGKTRLTSEFATWAALEGALVLRGRAFESGGRIPYQLLLNALRPALEAVNAPDDLLSDLWLAELGRLLPELLERYPDLPVPFNSGAAEARPRLFEAVSRLGEAFARQTKVLLYLDDLQWADADTLDLLQYAAQRWSESRLPLILLITVRSEALATGGEIFSWLNQLNRFGPVKHLTLGPLNAAAVADLLGQLAAEKSAAFTKLVGWLTVETGGQPFFLLETLKIMQERQLLGLTYRPGSGWQLDPARLEELDESELRALLPPSVRETIRARYLRLSPTGFSLLAAGAVIGRTFGFEQLFQVAGVSENEALSALDEILRHNLLKEAEAEGEANTYFFTHDKIRDVVYTEAGDARRRIFHRRALEFLQARPQPSAVLLAHHSLAAGMYELASKYYLAAGEESLRLFAVREAISNFSQGHTLLTKFPALLTALTDPTRLNWFLNFGRAYELLGDFDRARAVYQELLDYGRQQVRPDLTCTALYRLANVYFLDGLKLDQAEGLLVEAELLAEATGNKLALAEIAWNKAQACRFRIQPLAGLAQASKALQLALELEERELTGRSLSTLAYLEASYGRLEQAAEHAQEAVQIYRDRHDKALEADNLALVAETLIKLGRVEEGVAVCRMAYTINQQIDSVWGQRVALNTLSMGLVHLGKYAEALEICDQGLALNRTQFMPMHQVFTLSVRGSILRAIAMLPAALADHQEVLDLNHQIPGEPFAFMLNDALAVDYALLGDWQEAEAHIRQGYEPVKQGTFLWADRLFPAHVTVLLKVGRQDQARQELKDYARITGSNPFYSRQIKQAQAYLLEAETKLEPAISLLEEVATGFEADGMLGESWPVYRQLAALYRQLGEPLKAQAMAERALNQVETLLASLPPVFRGGLETLLQSGLGF